MVRSLNLTGLGRYGSTPKRSLIRFFCLILGGYLLLDLLLSGFSLWVGLVGILMLVLANRLLTPLVAQPNRITT